MRVDEIRQMAAPEEPPGIAYAPGVTGKRAFRVSERYLADHIGPLIVQRRVGAAKLDLVLRGIALSPDHAGNRPAGTVLRKRTGLDYATMHDLVRDPRRFATGRPEDDDGDRDERNKKREWIREQLIELEARELLRREDLRDGRRQILSRCDLGNGTSFDDPGAAGDARRSYITILGAVITDDRFRHWGAPELVGYLCAMIADRYARQTHEKKTGDTLPHGSATWYRQADWFNNKNGYRPDGHVIMPFSTSTIERGLKAMQDLGYIESRWGMHPPGGGQRFQHRRKLYTNRFNQVAESAVADIIDLDSRRNTA